jgi:hypothetical protein
MSSYKKDRLVSEWSNEFADLFKKHDSSRSPEEIWIATMAYCSSIGEAIRRTNYRELIDFAAHTFNWMCSFVTKCNQTDDLLFICKNDFCDMVYFKFPGICGHCLDNHCSCNPIEIDKKKDKAAQYKKLFEESSLFPTKNFSITDWTKMFKKIYGGRIYLMTLENIGFHFLEESGEEALAIRELMQMRGILTANIPGINEEFLFRISSIDGLVEEYDTCMKQLGCDKPDITSREEKHLKARIVKGKMDLIIEFADTFSWFCAVLIKLEMIAESLNVSKDQYDLEKWLEKKYGLNGEKLTCPRCKSDDCECLFFPKRSIDTDART